MKYLNATITALIALFAYLVLLAGYDAYANAELWTPLETAILLAMPTAPLLILIIIKVQIEKRLLS